MSTIRGTPTIASVVVALNPHDHDLGPVMDAWADQAGAGPYEVVVVHDGCRPTIHFDFAAHHARHPATPVRIVNSQGRGRAASNNAGVGATRGELLIFVADDFRPGRTLVAAHRAFHALHAAPVVGIGPGCFDEAHRDDPFLRWLEDSGVIFGVVFPTARLQWRDDFFYVGNASLQRKTFEEVGGFDEEYRHDLFDDWEFGQRLLAAGMRTHFVPRALAWHDHELTLSERLVSLWRLGEAARTYEEKHCGSAPWAGLAARSVGDLEANLRAESQHASASASIGVLRRRWHAAFDLAFARGYHTAQVAPCALPAAD